MSAPAILFGTAKIHTLKSNETVEELPIRPIISNISAASNYKVFSSTLEKICGQHHLSCKRTIYRTCFVKLNSYHDNIKYKFKTWKVSEVERTVY